MRTKGFTLIETLIGAAVFVLVAVAAYQAYVNLFNLAAANQTKILALNLANEQIEIVRNLPYQDVGVVGSIPSGKTTHNQTLTRGGIAFGVTTTIRDIDLPFDGTIGGTPNDLSPADNKLVAIEIDCANCKNFKPIEVTTTVAPKSLETASTNGALFINVFDANGQPVSNASVHVVNSKVTPSIVIDDVTNDDGVLQIVDAPPGVEAYAITVTKPGYSSARTYPASPSNPSPTQRDATVLLQQVTNVSFAIDQVSVMNFTSMLPTCAAVPSVHFSLTGAKLIGDSLNKYAQNLVTNGSGAYSSSTMEWDTYNINGIDSTYDIIGVNPLNPVTLNPNTTQNVALIVQAKNPESLLVTVKDNTTELPLADATVTLTNDGPYSNTETTGRGFINQTDWSGGGGQIDYTNSAKYFGDDGNIDTTGSPGDIKLLKTFGNYASSGVVESSTIDTGSPSNFYNLIWSPTNQPVQAGTDSLKFQFATNATNTATTTWNYLGPDGTSGSYYTVSNAVLNSVHNGDRFVRYKAFLSTVSSTSTPNVSDVAFTFTSQCTPPGQVFYSGLADDTYHVTVSKPGYTTTVIDTDVSSPWQEQVVELSP